MQHAFEDLDASANTKGAQKVLVTMAEDAADAARSAARAETHTRPQLKMLIAELVAKRDRCVNADVRAGYDAALQPLQARVQRYADIAAAEKARRDKIKKRKEEAEFKAMMEGWVSTVAPEAVEAGFEDVAEYQVAVAHARDVAREKWRVRARAKRRSAALGGLGGLLPLGNAVLRPLGGAGRRGVRRGPVLGADLPRDVAEERVNALVDALWEWQGEVDVQLCDAFKAETFERLPETVRDLDLAALLLAGRNKARKPAVNSTQGLAPTLPQTPAYGAGSGATRGRAAAASGPAARGGAERPWTATPEGLRSGLAVWRRAYLEKHLLRSNEVKRALTDPEVQRKVKALVDELLWRLAELDDQGHTTSSTGNGGDGLGTQVGESNSAVCLIQ